MGEEIQEIPLNIPEELPEDAPEPTAPEPAEATQSCGEPIRPKAKGRPKGSQNKGPSKPRAKKAQIQETPVDSYQGDDLPAYQPSSPKRNLKLPTDPSSSDVAAAMLKLLQDQTYTRQARKQRLYQSWFQ